MGGYLVSRMNLFFFCMTLKEVIGPFELDITSPSIVQIEAKYTPANFSRPSLVAELAIFISLCVYLIFCYKDNIRNLNSKTI